jgi:transposase-like protein
MRNILQKVKKTDYQEVKRSAQAIYQADGIKTARLLIREFRMRWVKQYPAMVDNSIRACGGLRQSPKVLRLHTT